MKQRLTNNLLLKIISIVIAFIVWLLVANVTDPVVVKSYSVPITIQNGAYLESGGMSYLVEEDQMTVTVVLRGNSSVVENRSDDITAVADLTQIVSLDTDPVMVPVTASCDGVSVESITVVPTTIEVDIEDMVSQDFTITVTTGETTPNSSYEVGSLESDPEKITVTGPESIISRIDRVTAEVDVSAMTDDTTISCGLKIYDKNQDELSDAQLAYLKFDIGDAIVDVTVDLWEVRDEVELVVGYTGSAASGYQVGDISVTPSTISVAGTEEALAALKEAGNQIIIPDDAVELSGQSSDFETKLNLADYMPDDVILANSVSTAIVTVSIIPQGSRQFTTATKNISVENLADDLVLTYDTDKLTVRIKANDAILEALTADDIGMTLDMSDQEAGDYEVEVDFTLPDGCELVESVTVLVHVTQLE